MANVEGKVAFVTGGCSGIGLGISYALLNAGMRVVITYRTKEHLNSALALLGGSGEHLHAICLDVTDRNAVAEAAQETIRVFGKVHVLVCNAGVAPTVPLSNATFDDFDWCVSVNIHGVFNGIHAFLPHIKAHGEGGQIVSTSSMVGGLVVGPFWGIYSTSKFAVVGMMEALRSELVDTNIGVSVFCPAGVKSNLVHTERNRPAAFANAGTPDAITAKLIDRFRRAMRDIMNHEADWQPLMDPIEAGQRVLAGIRHNHLYILSHAEYAQALHDRGLALLASIPAEHGTVSEGRLAVAEATRNSIYADEVKRRRIP